MEEGRGKKTMGDREMEMEMEAEEDRVQGDSRGWRQQSQRALFTRLLDQSVIYAFRNVSKNQFPSLKSKPLYSTICNFHWNVAPNKRELVNTNGSIQIQAHEIIVSNMIEWSVANMKSVERSGSTFMNCIQI